MTTELKFHDVEIENVKVEREDRQRSELKNIDELAQSIKNNGLLQPIVINELDFRLIAGERRLEACRKLGWETIPTHFLGEMEPTEAQLLELEENVRRQTLHWKDQAEAYLRIHELLVSKSDEDWSVADTVNFLGDLSVDGAYLSRILNVAKALRAGHKGVHEAHHLYGAINVLHREYRREVEDEVSKMDVLASETTSPSPDAEDQDGSQAVNTPHQSPALQHSTDNPQQPKSQAQLASNSAHASAAAADDDHIQCVDFLEWAPNYTGRRFNMLHVDFPFGINHHSSGFGGMAKWQEYLDTKDLYWQLCQCLVDNIDRLLFPSAHIIFWLSMKYYAETLWFFEHELPDVQIIRSPLVWHKSDNRGIVSDPERVPRHTYETALFMSRGDRKIIRSVADSYAAPARKSESSHVSEKPEPVLKHFFRLCVDELSEVLDPACGSGTALTTAETMGASRVLGLDISEEICRTARANFRKHRKLQRMDRTRDQVIGDEETAQ